MRTKELNRIKVMSKSFERSCKRLIKVFDTKKVARLEKQLDKHVQEQAEWAERKAILMAAPGVGETLAYTLLANMPEPGMLSELSGGR